MMDKAPDFRIKMHTGIDFHLYSAIKNGPVILNFIMGTWCPFCTAHIKKIREWQEAKGLKKLIVIIISTESIESIRAWSQSNHSSFIFCSDQKREVIDRYGVNFPIMNISRPATVLVDQDGLIRKIGRAHV